MLNEADKGSLIDSESTKDSHPADITEMREKLGSINYLVTMTRPDLAFAISRLQEHMHDPRSRVFADLYHHRPSPVACRKLKWHHLTNIIYQENFTSLLLLWVYP